MDLLFQDRDDKPSKTEIKAVDAIIKSLLKADRRFPSNDLHQAYDCLMKRRKYLIKIFEKNH